MQRLLAEVEEWSYQRTMLSYGSPLNEESRRCSREMAAYSVDLRERIVEAVEQDVSSKREIARLFGVHESFLYKLLRQKRERGDLARYPMVGERRRS